MATVGEILKQAREAKQFSLEDASRYARIHTRFLLALELGDYQLFSSPVHLQGFLKNYARFLGLPADKVLAFYRREHVFKDASIKKSSRKIFGLLGKWWPPTGKKLGFLIFALFCICFLVYLSFQYHRYAGVPNIQIKRPAMGEIVSTELLLIEGTVSKGVQLTLNDQKVPLDAWGNFSLTVNLLEGRNSFHLVARNNLFGKESSSDLLVFYKP